MTYLLIKQDGDGKVYQTKVDVTELALHVRATLQNTNHKILMVMLLP
jgi:hypothetical protein